MTQPILNVYISDNGSIKLMEVEGGDGKNCLELSRPLEEAMGGAIERTLKEEYRRDDRPRQTQQRLGSR